MREGPHALNIGMNTKGYVIINHSLNKLIFSLSLDAVDAVDTVRRGVQWKRLRTMKVLVS